MKGILDSVRGEGTIGLTILSFFILYTCIEDYSSI